MQTQTDLFIGATDGPAANPPTERKRYLQTVRLSMVRDRSTVLLGSVQDSATASRIAREFLGAEMGGDPDREVFGILLLDRKNNVNAAHVVSIGSLGEAPVHPREVFKAAVLANASAVVCFHNHPSGDTAPSGDDRTITTRLREGGDILGVKVLDHIILGEGKYFSFADSGMM